MPNPIYGDSAIAPCRHAAAVVPHDSNELAFVTKQIYIGGAGNIALKLRNSPAAVTFVGVSAGQVLDVAAVLVMSTNTTATNIVALG